MLRLVIDTDGIDAEADPKVVYLGHSASAAQKAIDGSESAKLSIVEIPWLRRAKKSPTIPTEEKAPEQPLDLTVPTLEELMTTGSDGSVHTENSARMLIARQQAMADAFATDPTLSREALEKIGDEASELADDGLDAMTIEELKSLADDEGIEYAGAHLKQDYVDIVRLFHKLDDAHTVETLKEIAAAEEVETKGFTRKAEFINAIASKRRIQNFP